MITGKPIPILKEGHLESFFKRNNEIYGSIFSSESEKATNQLKAERKKQAKYLRHGDMRLLARKAKITIGSVSNWINGRVETSVCKVYFEELVKIRKHEMESAMEEI